MKSFYRVLARTHLQQTIPGKITHLRVLLDSGSDASSVLWPGHTATEAFNKVTFFQPADPEIAKLVLKVTMPDQVVGPSDEISDEENDEPSETTDAGNGDAKKGSKVGARWFDVFPQNEVQDKLVKMSVKFVVPSVFTLHSEY